MGVRLFEEIEMNIKTMTRPDDKQHKYIFIGLPDQAIPTSARVVFFELQVRGYIPVIACAERNVALRKNLSTVREFVENDVLIHISGSSIIGNLHNGKRKWALRLLRQGLIHFVEIGNCKYGGLRVQEQRVDNYLVRKLPCDTVKQLRANAACLASGEEFHSISY